MTPTSQVRQARCYALDDEKGMPTVYRVRLVRVFAQTTEERSSLDIEGIADKVIYSTTSQTRSETFSVYCECCDQEVDSFRDYGRAVALAAEMNARGDYRACQNEHKGGFD